MRNYFRCTQAHDNCNGKCQKRKRLRLSQPVPVLLLPKNTPPPHHLNTGNAIQTCNTITFQLTAMARTVLHCTSAALQCAGHLVLAIFVCKTRTQRLLIGQGLMARVLDIIIPATIPKHRKHIRECAAGWMRLDGMGWQVVGSAVAVDQAKVLWGPRTNYVNMRQRFHRRKMFAALRALYTQRMLLSKLAISVTQFYKSDLINQSGRLRLSQLVLIKVLQNILFLNLKPNLSIFSF